MTVRLPFTIEADALLITAHPHMAVDFNDEDYDSNELVDISGFSARTQSEGHGTRAMTAITELADQHQVGLEVFAGVKADGCDATRLIDFYSRFGFVLQPTPWDEECGLGRPWLIRRPQ